MENTVRILLVEDSRVIRRENQAALLKAGHEVICAEDGEIALAMANEFTPELILLDMIIPKINGPEVLQRLKKNPVTAPIPVVVVSSLSDKNREKLVEIGAEDYLEKGELMPERGVNLLPDLLKPIITRIQSRRETVAACKQDSPAEAVEDNEAGVDDDAIEIEEISIEEFEDFESDK
jgi:CheY-like chemotaxis protein